MFAVPKYAKALSALADERNVTKTLSHDLVEIDSSNRVATFKTDAGSLVTKEFDFLHAVPPQGPLTTIKESPLADAAGWVSVSPQTLQHTKFPNVFSLGDASSLPTSKTAAAVTSQTPVVVENLKAAMDGLVGKAVYDGYSASHCPPLRDQPRFLLTPLLSLPRPSVVPAPDRPRRAHARRVQVRGSAGRDVRQVRL